jgi:hypothetical protein
MQFNELIQILWQPSLDIYLKRRTHITSLMIRNKLKLQSRLVKTDHKTIKLKSQWLLIICLYLYIVMRDTVFSSHPWPRQKLQHLKMLPSVYASMILNAQEEFGRLTIITKLLCPDIAHSTSGHILTANWVTCLCLSSQGLESTMSTCVWKKKRTWIVREK